MNELLSEVPPIPRQPTAIPQQSSVNNQTDNRWISSLRQSLRRRDPEIQPTLPSINNHLHSSHHNNNVPTSVGYSIPNEKRIRTGKISANIRKSRSVDRMRARKVCQAYWKVKFWFIQKLISDEKQRETEKIIV